MQMLWTGSKSTRRPTTAGKKIKKSKSIGANLVHIQPKNIRNTFLAESSGSQWVKAFLGGGGGVKKQNPISIGAL